MLKERPERVAAFDHPFGNRAKMLISVSQEQMQFDPVCAG